MDQRSMYKDNKSNGNNKISNKLHGSTLLLHTPPPPPTNPAKSVAHAVVSFLQVFHSSTLKTQSTYNENHLTLFMNTWLTAQPSAVLHTLMNLCDKQITRTREDCKDCSALCATNGCTMHA